MPDFNVLQKAPSRRKGRHLSVVSASLALAALALPLDLGAQQVSVTSGSAGAPMVKAGEIQGARATDFVLEVESDEAGNALSSVPNLRVEGLGEGNLLLTNELALSVDGAPELDPSASSATIFLPQSSRVVDIAPYWAHDPATNQLRISTQAMQKILNQLPAGAMVVDVGLSSVDGSLGAAWTFPVHKDTAAGRH